MEVGVGKYMNGWQPASIIGGAALLVLHLGHE